MNSVLRRVDGERGALEREGIGVAFVFRGSFGGCFCCFILKTIFCLTIYYSICFLCRSFYKIRVFITVGL